MSPKRSTGMSNEQKQRLQQAKQNTTTPLDSDEFKAWILETNLDEYGFDTEKFGHINKNMATANLNSGQVEKLIRLSENVQLLRHFNTYAVKFVDENSVVQTFRGYDRDEVLARAETWAQHNKDVVERVTVEKSVENRHPPVLNLLVDNMTATEKATGGKAMVLLRMLKTLFKTEEKTVEDKSANQRQGWIESMLPNSSGGRRGR